jgi:hypothetical protein
VSLDGPIAHLANLGLKYDDNIAHAWLRRMIVATAACADVPES